MRRHIVGLIALVLLLGGAVIWLIPQAEDYQQFEGFCWRLGAIMGAWWLAYPDLARLPAWLLAGVPVFAVVLAKWPRYVVFLIPVLVVLAILRPRLGKKRRDG